MVPSFVGKWLKKTSATGFLSRSDDLSQRVQDLTKLPFLCENCEQIFSRLESHFAKTIWFPFQEKGIQLFKLDVRLELFGLSLGWRTLKQAHEPLEAGAPEYLRQVDKAEKDWRFRLLGGKVKIWPYETHLLLLDYVMGGEELPDRAQWYTMRGVESALVTGSKRIFAYTKLPGMVIATGIDRARMYGWQGTLLADKGTLSAPQVVDDPLFGGYLYQQAIESLKGTMPEWRKEAITKAILKNPNRLLNSKTLEVAIAERDRKLAKQMKNLPESVRALFTEAISQATDSMLTLPESNKRKLMGRRVANILAELSPEDATRLAGLIGGAIQYAKLKDGDTTARFSTKGLVLSFMVHPHGSKEERHAKLEEELEALKKHPGRQRNDVVVLFSLQVTEEGSQFEIGYWTED